jgi:hypothetical protein
MLRAALISFVLASAAGAVACGSGATNGPAVVAGAPAGDVTEISGTVTATRDGTPRPLAAGDVISGDDVIDTGADGRVTITLRHNRVAWTLGPGKKEQVGASLAWRAPTATQTAAGPTGERSGAAGRHAEREAADTAAGAEVAAAPMAPGAAAPAAAAAPMADPAPPAPRAAAAIADKGGAPDEQMAAAAQEREAMEAARVAEERSRVEALQAVEQERSRKMEAAPDSRRAGTGAKSNTSDDPLGDLDGIGLGGGGGGAGAGYGAGGGALGAKSNESAANVMLTTSVTGGALPPEVVKRIVLARKSALQACVKSPAPVASSTKLVIGTDGKVKEAQVVGADGELATCISGVYKRLAFPKDTGGPTTVQVRFATR